MRGVKVSAPAKVLLFGEHAVVYGSACVAAALDDLRLYVSVEAAASDAIELLFCDLVSEADKAPLRRSFALAQLREAAREFPEDAHFLPRPSAPVLARLDALLAREASAADAAALRPALFLCLALLRPLLASHERRGGVRVEVSATERFPIGAGLGSSAAFSVALAGALARFQDSGAAADSSTGGAALERVNAYAFAAEVLLHGTPSGVDNTVAAFGGALVFKRQPKPAFERVACDLNQFRFLLVDTRVARSTKQQVANVRALYEADRATVEQRFREIDALARAFVEHAQQDALSEAALARSIARNHALLNALGVGHDAIERVAALCGTVGAATKLTGAGGGGCTLSLLPRGLSDAALAALTAELEASGFQCYVSAVGGAGFRVEA
ncbi:hypothetical protein PybrP1_005320 [[Pythium] brassicae (nom. inval.)]|nr:hypothetical protein PybrP1_005320 [[Pythium] brassicae (nom. inval.)]